MRPVEFGPGYQQAERRVVHVLWLTSGLGCDGDSVAMTSATRPSLEDLLAGALPGMPRLAIYNPLFAHETGEDFMRAFWNAAGGRLDPFVLVLEGAVPNEQINGDGHWAAFGLYPGTREPIPTCTWLDWLAPKAAAVLALGTCAAHGGIPAMRGNPTGAMGLRDYLGPRWSSRLGVPIINLPGCPVQPDNITETLLHIALHLAGVEPMIDLDDQGRPRWLFGRTVKQGCGRAGFAEQGEFATAPGDPRGCLIKLGCKGTAVRCNVPIRGWSGGVGGCPNVGGICIGCTMPGFPDKFMPLMSPRPLSLAAARAAQFTYGPILRRMRRRVVDRGADDSPRRRAGNLGGASGVRPEAA